MKGQGGKRRGFWFLLPFFYSLSLLTAYKVLDSDQRAELSEINVQTP